MSDSVEQYKREREAKFREQFGEELNWKLSFDHLTETDTTKHVHRLFPYVGKYVPQLAAWFLDQNTDEFKQEVFFRPGDIILDPFAGSGTTAVQAAEMGIHCVGVELSPFSALIARTKLRPVDLDALDAHARRIVTDVNDYIAASGIRAFEREADALFKAFNTEHFPKPAYPKSKKERFPTRRAENAHGDAVAEGIMAPYAELCRRHGVSHAGGDAAEKWFPATVRDEFRFAKSLADQIGDPAIRDVFTLILGRTMRSCRATTHFALGSPTEPVRTPYYCFKHSRVCRPIMSMRSRFGRYAADACRRLREFAGLRQDARSLILTGDSRTVEIFKEAEKMDPEFHALLEQRKFAGIFCSPPYLGTLDYHENQAVNHHLFGFDRHDELEIGPKFKGTGKAAKQEYADGLAAVLRNAAPYLRDDYNVFLVAHDKDRLYPGIAAAAGMRIEREYLRPVLNRANGNGKLYAETIFHLRRA